MQFKVRIQRAAALEPPSSSFRSSTHFYVRWIRSKSSREKKSRRVEHYGEHDLNSAYEPLRNVILHARIGYMMQNHSAPWIIPLLGSWYSLCLPPHRSLHNPRGSQRRFWFFDTVAWILDRVLDSNALRWVYITEWIIDFSILLWIYKILYKIFNRWVCESYQLS